MFNLNHLFKWCIRISMFVTCRVFKYLFHLQQKYDRFSNYTDHWFFSIKAAIIWGFMISARRFEIVPRKYSTHLFHIIYTSYTSSHFLANVNLKTFDCMESPKIPGFSSELFQNLGMHWGMRFLNKIFKAEVRPTWTCHPIS
jgi:hypothetical protein